jgi:hypothetical protein
MRLVLAFAFLLAGLTGAIAQTGTGNGNTNIGNNNGSYNGSTINTKTSRVTATGVAAPGLTSGPETCLGSTSVGGSVSGVGLSFGTTQVDRDCNIRLYSRTLSGLGLNTAATQILCYSPEVAQVLAVQGIRCVIGPNAPPPPPYTGSIAIPAATAVPRRCRNYDFFRGCLDGKP